LAAAAATPTKEMDLMKELRAILEGKVFSRDGDAAKVSEETETLSCAICMCAIEDFFDACCMTCVCEGVYHRDCIQRVERTQGAQTSRCPYCRTEGEVSSLYQSCLPSARRETLERSIRTLSAPDLRRTLLSNEEEIRKRSQTLSERLARLKRLKGEAAYASIVHVAAELQPVEAPHTTMCLVCRQGILDFSDLTTQRCECSALYHPACLKRAVESAPAEKILCCFGCRKADVSPEGVPVKALVAARVGVRPSAAAPEAQLREAEAISEGQRERLAQLETALAKVADATSGLDASAAESAPGSEQAGPAKKRRRRLSYLPW